MFDAASGCGVRLQRQHRLVTDGPYRYVRHPMYLAVVVAGFGGMLIFRTWAIALFAVTMLGLVFQARQEEEALAQEFGERWEAYARQVPAWMPRRPHLRREQVRSEPLPTPVARGAAHP
jgi:protein-S-isoprenylcysteine O-methyltransferase Ste14